MSENTEKTGVQAVLFALQIMEHVAVQPEAIGVTALAEYFGTNKSRIFRHLKTLAQQGYVVQEEASERYRIGARLVALSHAIGESVDIVREARIVMKKVRNTLNHSVVLSMLDQGGLRVVAVESGTTAVEITVKPGSLLNYHSSAQGKIALAFGSPALLAKTKKSGLAEHTPKTITTPEKLDQELERVRQQGWAIAPNEAVTGLNALATPIFDASGSLVASIAIVDSVQFIGEQPTALQIETLVHAGLSISESIGFKARRVMHSFG
jgi:DNA-binding IclR family transcriptional regulator